MITRSTWHHEYEPGLFALAIDTYMTKRAESQWTKMCTVKTSKKKSEVDALRSGLGFPVLKGEGVGVAYDTQIGGPQQTWVHDVYALAVRITEEAVEDNLYELNGGGEGDFKELHHDLGEAMAENLEVFAARFLNSATATTYHTTRWSDALISTAHDRMDGTTFSNYSTSSDLTYLTFWAAVVAAENQYNHRQYRITKKVKRLWVPPQLERAAIETLKSTERPDTGNRAVSALAKSGRNIELVVWPHLSDADAWFLQLDGEGIRFFWRRKTRFARERDFATGDYMIKADQRFSAEITDPQGWYGNVPA